MAPEHRCKCVLPWYECWSSQYFPEFCSPYTGRRAVEGRECLRDSSGLLMGLDGLCVAWATPCAIREQAYRVTT